MIQVSSTYLVIAGLTVAVAFFVVQKLLSKDTEIEDRRRGAVKLSAKLQEYGLVRLSAILADYAVGDYSGIANKVKSLVDLIVEGEDPLMKELDAAFDRVLVNKLKSEAGRALVAAKLGDAAKASDPSAVNEAPKAKAS